MKQKKLIVCILVFVTVVLCSGCGDDNAMYMQNDETIIMSSCEETDKIYRTYTGECYHRDGCNYLRSRIETSADEIKAKGLRPCSKCEPPCFE